MKFPKYSCSSCGKPSSRKWNLNRHISYRPHYVAFPRIDRFLKTYTKFNTVHNNEIHGDILTQDHRHTLCTLTGDEFKTILIAIYVIYIEFII